MARTHARKTRHEERAGIIATAAKGVLMTAGVAAIANIGRKMVTQAPAVA